MELLELLPCGVFWEVTFKLLVSLLGPMLSYLLVADCPEAIVRG